MKNPNRQKSGECSPSGSRPKSTVSRSLESPDSYIATKTSHSSKGALSNKPMIRKKPLPVKELKEELNE